MKRILFPVLIAQLIVALVGGPAFADFPGSPIGGGSGGTTSASDLSSGTLPAARIGDNSVTNAKIVDASLDLAGTKFTGKTPVANGGTGSDNAAGARANLGLGTVATQNVDNVAIAGGAISGTTIAGVSDVYYDPSSSIQDQLDAKAPVASPTFTGTTTAPKVVIAGTLGGTIDNTVIGGTTPAAGTFTTATADEFVSTAADNTRGVTVPNTADPTGANLAPGKGWWNNTSNMLKWSGSDNAVRQVFTSGASHTLNFATTGTLTGGIMILDNVASPTAAQVYGSWNTMNTDNTTVTLPAVAAGMSTCIATTAALNITLELDGSDTFVLEGVTMDAGEAIINTTAEAAGDYICVIGISDVIWRVAGKQGTWSQATP